MYGGVIGLLVALATVFKQKLSMADIARSAMWIGASSMFVSSHLILTTVRMIYRFCNQRHENRFVPITSLVTGSIDYHWLPVILFLLAGVMAFSTGYFMGYVPVSVLFTYRRWAWQQH
ncbi:hypothetical protein OH492_19530 [Vibrio chagasii]|nr:hypothetical protein [Vibrio chagasii]